MVQMLTSPKLISGLPKFWKLEPLTQPMFSQRWNDRSQSFDLAYIMQLVWMYRPNQLDLCVDTISSKKARGARDYHGQFEVIASNHIDVVDVTCFAGQFVDVTLWPCS